VLEYEISPVAQRQMAYILGLSEANFGVRASLRYRALIQAAIEDLANSPTRFGTAHVPELPGGYRTYHLMHSRRRGRKILVKNPRHIIVFRVTGESVLEIVAFLHDRMEIDRRFLGTDVE
jgi:toxin ParE1/3/4